MESFIHPQAIVESDHLGRGTRIWAFAHVMKGAVVGEDCNICEGCFIENGSFIGNRVTVKNSVSVWEDVRLEDDVFVGPNATFTNVRLPVSRERGRFEKTLIGKGACIGANATVVCGHAVGRYAFVGAGSVVTKDVPDFALVYGNPARVKGFLCACRQKLRFVRKKSVCPCGKRYAQLSVGKIKILNH